MASEKATSTLPSPHLKALFSALTTLYDDECAFVTSVQGNSARTEESTSEIQLLHQGANEPQPLSPEHKHIPRMYMNSSHRDSKPEGRIANLPGYFCFSSATLQPSSPPKRSSFNTSRRQEVARVRQLGACLRCRLLKRPCSGGNPCGRCVAAAREKLKTKALTWMECIRPSFEAMSIFESLAIDDHHHVIIQDLINRQDTPVSTVPFEVDLRSASERLVQWLLTGSNRSNFNVTGLLRSTELSALLSQVLGEGFGGLFGLMINLTNDVANRVSESMYLGHDSETYHAISHYVGTQISFVIESRLSATRLEASRNKLEELRSIFLVVLGMGITGRYTFLNTMIRGQDVTPEFKRKTEAFMGLLNHYTIYIAGLLRLVDPAAQKRLAAQCEFRWDRPGSSITRISTAQTDWDTVWRGMGSLDQSSTPDWGLWSEIHWSQSCYSCGNSWDKTNYNGLCMSCEHNFGLDLAPQPNFEVHIPDRSGDFRQNHDQSIISTTNPEAPNPLGVIASRQGHGCEELTEGTMVNSQDGHADSSHVHHYDLAASRSMRIYESVYSDSRRPFISPDHEWGVCSARSVLTPRDRALTQGTYSTSTIQCRDFLNPDVPPVDIAQVPNVDDGITCALQTIPNCNVADSERTSHRPPWPKPPTPFSKAEVEAADTYWTFFNQNASFEISSDLHKRTYRNYPTVTSLVRSESRAQAPSQTLTAPYPNLPQRGIWNFSPSPGSYTDNLSIGVWPDSNINTNNSELDSFDIVDDARVSSCCWKSLLCSEASESL